MSTIEYEGLDGMNKLLERLPLFAEKTVFKDACKEGAQIVADEAENLAPEGKKKKLKKAIRVRFGKSGRGRVSAMASVGKKWFDGEEFYGAFQEFGWKSGKRSNPFANQVKRVARQIREESRQARALGKGAGLARKGSAKRLQQEHFFVDEAARRILGAAAKGGTAGDRKQNPGEHFMLHAFEEKKQAALDAMLNRIKAGLDRELAGSA